ncbi:2'-5' RNA ligase family protein [Flavobacterium sp. DG1-102-2]|uniref:2'-5' RNA ligase family protein n=1 Tax=Flavobacterium sp. DG1-102-2 TaxID=3081663 RepID=UPI0029492BA2|nr:2'-5' RNA ligase family protein [Flavobacterium sp. DG1-102-2]MDV6167164.1 2'-5' RNA ligase family protein [Flavobacterium sp. DG1-102-2]
MAKRNYRQMALFGELYAYLVVLSPPETVKADIAKIKKKLNDIAYISDRNLHSIAHITLVDKLTDDADFAETIAKLITPANPFKVIVEGWSIFDHGHSVTVYLSIKNPEPIVSLMTLVKSTSKTPHISLAKKISYENFDMLKPYLESLNYSAEWLCDEVNVLRKLMSEKHLGFRESIKIKIM